MAPGIERSGRFAPLNAADLAARRELLLAAISRVVERSKWTPDKIRQWQTRELKALLTRVFAGVPFYRDKYARAGFDPSQFESLEDIHKIPLLAKEELRDAKFPIPSGPGSECRMLKSSGSTGMPLRIRRSEEALWQFTAFNMLLYKQWCGEKPISNVLYFIDCADETIDRALADLLRTTVDDARIVPSSESTDVLLEKVDEFSPEFISSYPSTMRNVAMTLEKMGRTNPKLKLLHLTSEMLDAGTRGLIARVFPRAKIVETFTSTEAGLLAFPCAHGGGLHPMPCDKILEIVDGAGRPTDGLGEVVVTDLCEFATPLIRYKGLGDYCRWAEPKCSHGCALPTLGQIEGRVADSIVLPDGSMMSPYNVADVVANVSGVGQYQIVQHEVDRFEVLIVKRPDGNEDAISKGVRAAMAIPIRHDFECSIRFVASIESPNTRHKIPLVVSHVRSRA